MTEPVKVRVERDWLEAIYGRPKWNVTVPEGTLASFVFWPEAVRYAYSAASRINRARG
jgi:hypothetical protein